MKIDKVLAKFFYMCNIPYEAVENLYFLQFIQSIIHYAPKNPNFTYKPPCKETLATTLLGKIHEEVIHEKKTYT